MSTPVELSKLALASYEKPAITDGFQIEGYTSRAVAFDVSGGNAASFAAMAFEKGNEVVISFRGTDGLKDIFSGWTAGAGLSFASSQLTYAAQYYKAVVAAFPDKTITLTGHSLGRGLAGYLATLLSVNAGVKTDQLSDGAIVVIDDYGWLGHDLQYAMWDEFAAKHDRYIASMPTGQGILVK